MNRWTTRAIIAACGAGAFLLGKAGWSVGDTRARETVKTGVVKSSSSLPAEPGSAVAWFERASLEDCEALIANGGLEKLSPLLREALFLRLSELDPQRLATLIFDMPGNGRGMASWSTWIRWLAKNHPEILDREMEDRSLSVLQRDLMEQAIRSLRGEFKGDPEAVFEESLKRGNSTRASTALSYLADSDPDLAINYLSKLMAEGMAFSSENISFFRKLANVNPAGLQALLPMARTPEQKNAIAAAVARVLARDDPSGAMELFHSLPASQARGLVAMEIATALTKKDPGAALVWVQENMPEGPARRKALAIALAPIAESDPAKVIPLLAGIRDSETSGMVSPHSSIIPAEVLEKAVFALMKERPLDAVRMLHSGAPDPLSPQPVLLKAVGTWLASDPEASLNWLAGLGKGEFARMASYTVFANPLKDMSPEAAAKGASLLKQIEDPQSVHQLAGVLAEVMGGKDLDAAIKAAEEVPEAERSRWLSHAIQSQAQVDPMAAAAEIHRLPESERSSVHLTVANQIARSSATQALAYLDAQPSAERDPSSYRISLDQAIRTNWSEVQAWWNKLPENNGIARAGALSAMSGRLYESDPTSLGQLRTQIGAISQENERAEALMNLVEGVARLDPDGARALADQPGMDLPDWARSQMANRLKSALKESP